MAERNVDKLQSKNPSTKSENIASGSGPGPQQRHSHKKEELGSPKKYHTRRRPPTKPVRRPNDVYISESSHFQSQYAKCQKLLDGEFKVIYLHGLGDAIPRALNLCSQLKSFYQGSLDYSVTTSTVKLVDDLLPTDDNSLPSLNYRTISAVDVMISRTVDLP